MQGPRAIRVRTEVVPTAVMPPLFHEAGDHRRTAHLGKCSVCIGRFSGILVLHGRKVLPDMRLSVTS